MSMNVYLKGEQVKELPGFKIVPTRESGRNREDYEISGIRLSLDKGRWSVYLVELDDPLPEAIAGIVEEISCYEWLPMYAHRTVGIYRLGTAEAEVEIDSLGKEKKYRIHLKAKTIKDPAEAMDDLRKLLHQFKTGKIQPAESYAEPQKGGVSRQELEARLDKEQRLCDQLLRRYQSLNSDIVELRSFATALKSEKWPLCTKSRAISEISRIFDREQVQA